MSQAAFVPQPGPAHHESFPRSGPSCRHCHKLLWAVHNSHGQTLFFQLLKFGAHQDALTALDVLDVANGGSEAFSSSGQWRSKPFHVMFSTAEEKNKRNCKEDVDKVQSRHLVQEEEMEKSRVGFWVYWKYLTLAYGGALVPFVLIAQIRFQVLQSGINYWMAWASPVSKDADPPLSMSTLIYVFVALPGSSSPCILVRAPFLVTAAYKT